MSYLTAIAKARHDILKDNEEPRDILISLALRNAVLDELGPMRAYRLDPDEELMGMKLEWTRPKPLNQPQIVIRTAKGDTRIVSMLSDASGDPHE